MGIHRTRRTATHSTATVPRKTRADRGSHSCAANGSNLDGSFVLAMLLGFVTMSLAYGWLVAYRYRVAQLEERIEGHALDRALDERRAEALVP